MKSVAGLEPRWELEFATVSHLQYLGSLSEGWEIVKIQGTYFFSPSTTTITCMDVGFTDVKHC